MAEINNERAVERFQAMLRKRTVSDKDGNFDREVFASYLPMLKEMYPTVFEVVESQLINEFGIVLKWKGKNSALNPVVLMSHYDVVGDEGQDWKHPAFEAEIHDGVIWARGSIDTKGLLAATLEAMEKLIAEGYTPPRDIYYCSSNCEEVAGDTMPKIVDWFVENNIKPWFVLDEGGAIMQDLPMGIKTPFAMVAVSEKGWATVKLKATAQGAAPAAKATKANSKLSAPQKIVKALAALEKSPTKSTITGQLEGMYYGRKIRNSDNLEYLYDKHAAGYSNSTPYTQKDTTLSLDHIALEYSAYGKGDYRLPAMELMAADGNFTTDFTFKSAAVTKVKPQLKGLPSSYGESETLTFFVSKYSLSSYDEKGQTGFSSSYVIEKGTYGFAVGDNVRDAERKWECTITENTLYQALTQVAAPRESFDIITAVKKDGRYEKNNFSDACCHKSYQHKHSKLLRKW